jgi:biotin synthase
MNNWLEMVQKSLSGTFSPQDALKIIQAPDDELLSIVHAASILRRLFFNNIVNVHILLNAKSGLCSEDCAFCSQSRVATTPIEKFPILPVEQFLKAASDARNLGADVFCIAISGWGPTDKELDTICQAVKEIKKQNGMKVCMSAGILKKHQAKRLKDAGVDRYNHNIETSKRFFSKICSTHTYQDRINTIKIAKEAGLEICCGGIVGMGEDDIDIVDFAFSLKELDVDSIPINFLNPRPGTPLENCKYLTPAKCLKILALLRFINPQKDIRAAAGREIHLDYLQPLSLYIVSSIFTNGYLTTSGNTFFEDKRMIEQCGFTLTKSKKYVTA